MIPSTITVKEFLMEWLPKQCNKHKWAPQTYQSNLGTVQNLIIPYIGDMQMQKLKPYHLEDLYATLGKMPCGQYYEGKKQVLSEKQQQRLLSGTTIHEVHRLLRTAFQYAVEWGILIKSPVPVDSPKKSIQERAIWNADEMWAALASIVDDTTLFRVVFYFLVIFTEQLFAALVSSGGNRRLAVAALHNRDFVVWTGHFVFLLSVFGHRKSRIPFQISCLLCRWGRRVFSNTFT